MAKYPIKSEKGAPPLGAYSQGWRAGDFIFVTGTGAIGTDGTIVGDTIEEQTHKAIDNLEVILEADGASLSDVIKVNVHLIDTNLFPRYNTVYKERFSEPFPGRTTVGSDLHQVPGMMIEIDCIAYVGE
jgi:2-iminobutanoate/2-iminopropanoate deaminase